MHRLIGRYQTHVLVFRGDMGVFMRATGDVCREGYVQHGAVPLSSVLSLCVFMCM